MIRIGRLSSSQGQSLPAATTALVTKTPPATTLANAGLFDFCDAQTTVEGGASASTPSLLDRIFATLLMFLENGSRGISEIVWGEPRKTPEPRQVCDLVARVGSSESGKTGSVGRGRTRDGVAWSL